LLPLLTFFHGYILSDKLSKSKEKRRLLRTYTYFVHYYSDQIAAIQKQINSIKKLLEGVKQMTHVMSFNLELVNQPYFIIDSINKSELFDVWCNVKKYDPNEYINLLKSIQYFKSSFENHKNYYNGFLPR